MPYSIVGSDMREQMNCDGSGPHNAGEVRVLPLAGGGNLILCYSCWLRELQWRRLRNRELAPEARYDLPAWEALNVYASDACIPGECAT